MIKISPQDLRINQHMKITLAQQTEMLNGTIRVTTIF